MNNVISNEPKKLEINTFYSVQIEPCMSIFYWYKNFILYLYIPT